MWRLALTFLLVANLSTLVLASEKQKEYPLSLKVINANSNPYVTHSGGSSHTDCNFGDTSANCDTYSSDTTWRHVQNTMLVEASDGKVYTIACTASVRWSKCVWLRVGETFQARWDKHGLVVLYHDSRDKTHEQTYNVLGSALIPSKPVEQPPTRVAAVSEGGVCNIVSNPSGADIDVDGAFVGNTPSSVSLRAGKHTIVISVKGYRKWTRELSLEGGSSVSLNAILESEQ